MGSAKQSPVVGGVMAALSGQLGKGIQGLASSAGRLAISTVADKLTKTTGRLTDYASNGGGPGLMSALTGGGSEDGENGGSGSGKQLKVTNIVEQLDIGAPVRVCYDQWTRFTDFPTFMKKVETVQQESDEKLNWRAQIFWSHRSWQATITEQVPDKRIVWRSTGDKGHVDGAVTFHELAPELTRMVVVLEYHPGGFFEKTANLWRAQGRRARLELKHFARQVMTQTVLHPEETKGWRGEIHDGEVTRQDEPDDEHENRQKEARDSGANRKSTRKRKEEQKEEQGDRK